MKNKTYRGSYTVEAAMLMSVILLILFMILRMNLFLTDQVRMTALLVEDCTYGTGEEQERSRWFAEAGDGFFLLQAGRIRRSAGSSRVTASYPAESIHLGYGKVIDPEQSFTAKEREPVKYLRTIRAVKNSLQ